MEQCPGCNTVAASNVVKDTEGRPWHRDCLEQRQNPVNQEFRRESSESRIEKLETERDRLRSIISYATKPLEDSPKPRGKKTR